MPIPFQIAYILNIMIITVLLGYKSLFNAKQIYILLPVTAFLGFMSIITEPLFSREVKVYILLTCLFLLFYLFIKKFLLTSIWFIIVYMFNILGQAIVVDLLPTAIGASLNELNAYETSLLCVLYVSIMLVLSFAMQQIEKKTKFFSIFDSVIKRHYIFSFVLLAGFYILNVFHFFYTYDSLVEYLFSLFFIQFYAVVGIMIAVFFIRSELDKERLLTLSRKADQLKTQSENVRDFQHDYNSLLLSIALHIKNNENDQALALIQSETEYFNDKILERNKEAVINISIAPVQGLLKIFLEKCAYEQIPYRLVVPQNINESDIMYLIDFIRCFSIMLNNALEASEECEKPFIQIEFYKKNNALTVTVQNRVTDISKININRMIKKRYTTKPNHKGRGLSILFKIVARYSNVDVSLYTKDDFFVISLLIDSN